jgi:hypothetical protein
MRKTCAATVVALASLLACRSTYAQSRQLGGYYVMQEVGAQNVKDVKLASPVFSGIVVRERWASIHVAPQTFNWAFLDSQAARARRLGKQYILSVYTGNNAPGWLGVPLYKMAPYPWDPTMLAAHGEMVAAMGARYGMDPNLIGVEIGGPTRGPNGSLEMYLAEGLTRQPGYSPERMAAAWIQCVDQYGSAFPLAVLISDGGVAPGGRDYSITQTVWNYMAANYPARSTFSHCALKANTAETAVHHQLVVSMQRRGSPVGFEMIGPSVAGVNGENGPVARFGGEFWQALEIAERAGASWLKMYQGDEYNAAAAGL